MDILELNRELDKQKEKLEEIRGHLDLEKKKEQIGKIEQKSTAPGFWDDNRKAQKLMKEMDRLKAKIKRYKQLKEEEEDIKTLKEFIDMGEIEFQEEFKERIEKWSSKIDKFETELLLNGEFDENNAILTLHSGAGGTESCDWAAMLYRMYTRWAKNNGYTIEVYDKLNGDEAGIKSATFLVKGENAYGYLQGEKGVHRLVRISPFDSNSRRHTSFASLDVTPEIDDEIEIEINDSDLKIDTYRASGAGGQHVNVTDSAVRITHLPTKTVVTCQNERSQIQNKETALKILKSRLFEIEMKKKEDRLNEMQGDMGEIAWGNQIRSYVLHPYQKVKDHRTDEETGNTSAVLDGDIDIFISAYLKYKGKSNEDSK
ncbi:MAG: peptide chain release factor 2 [Fusobacteriota bacterium]